MNASRALRALRMGALLLAAGTLLPLTASFASVGPVGPVGPVSPVATAANRTAPECTNADLRASYRRLDATLSHRYGRILLTNKSHHACVVGGYGGLSYVGGGNGTQIGAAADREPATVHHYLLQPRERVHSRVIETSFAPFPRSECRPRHVDGFRVYVPDATASQFIPHPTTGCANPDVHLLSHRPYRR